MVQKMGPNAYKLDLPADKYSVHSTFNVADLSLFVPNDDSNDDLRKNRTQVDENDAVQMSMTPGDIEDNMKVPFDGPITRARAKKIQDATKALLIRYEGTMEQGFRPSWITLLRTKPSAQKVSLRPQTKLMKTRHPP